MLVLIQTELLPLHHILFLERVHEFYYRIMPVHSTPPAPLQGKQLSNVSAAVVLTATHAVRSLGARSRVRQLLTDLFIETMQVCLDAL